MRINLFSALNDNWRLFNANVGGVVQGSVKELWVRCKEAGFDRCIDFNIDTGWSEQVIDHLEKFVGRFEVIGETLMSNDDGSFSIVAKWRR